MARSFSRQPVAIAPGLTVQARNLYTSYGAYDEFFVIDGKTQALSLGEAKRLKKNLDVWLEVVAFKAEQKAIEAVNAEA
jgi:hypothetical protein